MVHAGYKNTIGNKTRKTRLNAERNAIMQGK